MAEIEGKREKVRYQGLAYIRLEGADEEAEAMRCARCGKGAGRGGAGPVYEARAQGKYLCRGCGEECRERGKR